MAQPGFIFGGNTGMSYDQIQKQRDIANELLRANMSTPQNVGEGLSAIGRALAAKAIDKRASRADADNRKAYEASRDGTFAALGGYGGGSGGMAAPVTGPTPITFTPETPNPAGLDPSIIGAVDRVAPNAPQQMDAGAIGPRLVSDLARDFNLTPEQAAGVAGNLAHETGGFKHMQEISPMIPGSRGGYGFAQWTGPRRKAFEAWTAQNGLDPNSYEANYGFLAHELKNTPEGAVLGPLSQAQTPDQAAAVFSDQFLRPGIPNMDSRTAYANQFAQGGQPQGAAPIPTAGGAGNGMANPAVLMKLAEVMGNPYASESDKAIAQLLMDQTVQSMDPMRQMEMQKAQLELQQMQQPEAPKPIEVGGVLLDPQTFQPIFDSRQPQGPAAIVNVDNAQPAGPGADEEALRGALGKKEGESWSTYIDSAVTSSGTMQDMQLLDELINVAPQGPLQGRLAQALPGFSAAADAFQSVVKRVAPTLRAPGSGATSDIEYDGMLKSLPQLSSRPEANRAIAAMMKAKAEINVQRGEIVRSYQNGQLSLSDARKQISEIDQKSIMTPELEGLINGLSEADTGAMDFSKMSAAELADVDIGTLTPEQMDAMLKRFDEVGQ